MTTRLSDAAREYSKNSLLELLNNVVQFVECPLDNREQFVNMWNDKMPVDLVKSLQIMSRYEIGWNPVSTGSARFTVNLGSQPVSALVRLDQIGPEDADRQRQGHLQKCIGLIARLRADESVCRRIRMGKSDSVGAYCIEMTPEYICKHLGEAKTQELLDWMKSTAKMYDELKLAASTVRDIFNIANTAGQIKRMVPDLLQYMPANQRAAFEQQKRSSTMPFEWAPYPKENVENMLLQISKGHLLSKMGKPKNSEVTVCLLNEHTWSRNCEWA